MCIHLCQQENGKTEKHEMNVSIKNDYFLVHMAKLNDYGKTKYCKVINSHIYIYLFINNFCALPYLMTNSKFVRKRIAKKVFKNEQI
jgi:hypothetical protein